MTYAEKEKVILNAIRRTCDADLADECLKDLRPCLHNMNTQKELESLVDTWRECLR